MTEVTLTTDTPSPLPEGVRHVPGPPLPRPVVLLKAVIAGTEQYWYVYERADDTADSVAQRVAKTQRHINWLRERFGGTDVPPTPPPPATKPAETHDCEWHGPMRESTKAPGTWFCPKRKADGTYCPSRWPVRAGEPSAK
jgi:hypothetical protein